MDHRPHRRHQELCARCADLGHVDRARTRGRVDRRRRVGARARHALVGRPRPRRVPRRRADHRVVGRRHSADAQLSFAWDTAERFHADGIGPEARRPLARVLAHTRHRRLLAAPPRRRGRVRHRDRPDRLACGTSPRSSRSSKKPAASGRRSAAGPTSTAAASCAPTACCTTRSSRRWRSVARRVGADGRDRYRNVVGESRRRRRGRQHRRPLAHPARLLRSVAAALRARRRERLACRPAARARSTRRRSTRGAFRWRRWFRR